MVHAERRTKALLVEDDPNIVDLIRGNLAVRGFATCTSTDGWRTLQLLETEAPDIVPLDLMLPDADGFELSPANEGALNGRHNRRLCTRWPA